MLQTSNVLVVGHPTPERMDFGADNVASFKEARRYLEQHQPAVLVFGPGKPSDVDSFCKTALERAPAALWIMATEGLSPSVLVRWNNTGRLHDVIDSFNDPELVPKIQSALEASGEQAQRSKLVELFEDQSATLKRLSAELEARVEKRHKTLRKSLKTMEQTKTRLEAFHKALLGIHRASTILQMEQTLNEALAGTVSMVRIRFESQSSIKQQMGPQVLAIDLPFQFERLRGQVLFAKENGKRFTPAESDFFHELSEALALALSRLHKLEQAEVLKAQWQATFDSIPHPLCLTTKSFEILKINRAFQQASRQQSFHSLIGKNCFTMFFGTDFKSPAELEQQRFSFRAARAGARETEHFEVAGETLATDERGVHLILMRSITEEVRFERRIFEASKLAELGTIGSSIAHELNNPLGGMLSFLQLILMDLKKTDALFSEIKSMEEAVLRCRDIVQNLLSFARKQDLGDFTGIDLRDVIERAVKLIELQSKSMGIEIEVVAPEGAPVKGSANALSQALCNLLQNSIDAIAERLKSEPMYPGRIRLRLDTHKGVYQLRVTDNGTGIKPDVQTQIFNPLFTTRDPGLYAGMGLTTAFTIVNEHHGSLEILSQTGSGTTAIMSLPRLDITPD